MVIFKTNVRLGRLKDVWRGGGKGREREEGMKEMIRLCVCGLFTDY